MSTRVPGNPDSSYQCQLHHLRCCPRQQSMIGLPSCHMSRWVTIQLPHFPQLETTQKVPLGVEGEYSLLHVCAGLSKEHVRAVRPEGEMVPSAT